MPRRVRWDLYETCTRVSGLHMQPFCESPLADLFSSLLLNRLLEIVFYAFSDFLPLLGSPWDPQMVAKVPNFSPCGRPGGLQDSWEGHELHLRSQGELFERF